MVKVCIVTVNIGEKYLEMYNNIFKKSHEEYAKKCGYDFIIVTDYIRGPYHSSLCSLQKILVCEIPVLQDYDYVIFIDSDIVINKNTPPIHLSHDFGDKIGVVSNIQPNLEIRHQIQRIKGYEVTAKEYYKIKCNHDIDTDHIINTGLLVTQPKKHRKILSDIYDYYSKFQYNNPNGFHYEQCVVGYELQKNNLFTFMDIKWNSIWYLYKFYHNDMLKGSLTLQEFLDQTYFVHLAGGCDWDLEKSLK